MRVLEVRFRPQLDEPLLIIGHLIWNGRFDREPALIRRGRSLEGIERSEMYMAKLEYLVSSTFPDSFTQLQEIQSRFWSFVEVAPAALQAPSGTSPAMVKSWLRPR